MELNKSDNIPDNDMLIPAPPAGEELESQGNH